MNSGLPTSESNTPAWKRIGLKLKFSKNEASGYANNTTHAEQDVQRPKRTAGKAMMDGSRPILSPKKVKRQPSQSTTVNSRFNDSTQPLETFQTSSGTNTQTSLLTPQVGKRKSVTFTPDTKAEDGDSVRQLFRAWVAEQKAEDPSSQAEKIVKAFESGAPPSKSAKEAKTKERDTKEQWQGMDDQAGNQLHASSTMNVAPLHSAIVYLLDHHRSRGDWKFNKAKQGYLLKHLFDFDKVPSDYDEALRGYIVGLRGRGVRARVREAAEKIKTEEASNNSRAADFTVDVNKKIERAEWLLSALWEPGGDDTSTPQVNSTAANNVNPKKLIPNSGLSKSLGRKRKRRTLLEEDSDSSSSDSDNSRD
jgi:WKF domain